MSAEAPRVNRLPYERIHRSTSAGLGIKLLRAIMGGWWGETVARSFLIDPQRSLFYFALATEASHPKISYWEFGVGWGGTLSAYLRALEAFCQDYHRNFYANPIVLFDSFEGLPEKAGGRDDNSEWGKGVFSHDVNEISRVIKDEGVDPSKGSVKFVQGFFKDRLTPRLREELMERPPDIVTIDVDYYSSTKTILDWLPPLLRDGTIFYFDDIWSFNGNPGKGELAAIREFNEGGQSQLVSYPVFAPTTKAANCYIYSTN